MERRLQGTRLGVVAVMCYHQVIRRFRYGGEILGHGMLKCFDISSCTFFSDKLYETWPLQFLSQRPSFVAEKQKRLFYRASNYLTGGLKGY
ncbi:unnamed protein product [Protopolystoma xenopodis]|uniref:Uncharacterized protein n=1 Tax=Protopolystoma xenopodis TaxID=117903 RepID=A0A448WG71_9PLAT|nr:unnamed protein product [Protopolystoma xenopodis]